MLGCRTKPGERNCVQRCLSTENSTFTCLDLSIHTIMPSQHAKASQIPAEAARYTARELLQLPCEAWQSSRLLG